MSIKDAYERTRRALGGGLDRRQLEAEDLASRLAGTNFAYYAGEYVRGTFQERADTVHKALRALPSDQLRAFFPAKNIPQQHRPAYAAAALAVIAERTYNTLGRIDSINDSKEALAAGGMSVRETMSHANNVLNGKRRPMQVGESADFDAILTARDEAMEALTKLPAVNRSAEIGF